MSKKCSIKDLIFTSRKGTLRTFGQSNQNDVPINDLLLFLSPQFAVLITIWSLFWPDLAITLGLPDHFFLIHPGVQGTCFAEA